MKAYKDMTLEEARAAANAADGKIEALRPLIDELKKKIEALDQRKSPVLDELNMKLKEALAIARGETP